MSSHLWRAYFENDLEKFRSLLGLSEDRTGGTRESATGSLIDETLSSLPSPPRRYPVSSLGNNAVGSVGDSRPIIMNRFQINSRLPANTIVNQLAPAAGVTLLHHAAVANKLEFVEALLNHPQTDIFLQDFESGWTGLHRALYFGNISIAKQILSRDDAGTGLVKIKDREGNSPFELFSSTIKVDNPKKYDDAPGTDNDSDGEGMDTDQPHLDVGEFRGEFLGDEAFVWGSNKNLSLGFSDGDDRQFPERISIPASHLVDGPRDALVTLAPVLIRDIQMAKFHTAILTTASSNNLYTCGYGPGGRLGLGHESTEFTFKQVCLPRKVRSVALGQDHTVAVTENGDVFTWGTGKHGQLGYPVSIGKNDKEEHQLVPRQVSTNLRREKVIGAAASKHHSVVHTTDSIFVFGKNEGQLGLSDVDTRNPEMQTSPRKVAPAQINYPILMVTTTDRATAVLLESHDVWMFMNYKVIKLVFPFERFLNTGITPTRPSSKYQDRPNFITKLSSGGGTIAALSRMGDVFTINIDKTAATTTKSLPVPQRIWSLRKRHMAVRDVDVGQEGAVIICTESGSVWQRTRRSKVKEPASLGVFVAGAQSSTSQYLDRAKDYKFARVPGLTHIVAVRSNAFGSFATIRRDVDVLKTKLDVCQPTLWGDLGSLLSFYDEPSPSSREEVSSASVSLKADMHMMQKQALDWFLRKDLINILKETINEMNLAEYDTVIKSADLDEIGISIPAHSFILAGRCPRLRPIFARAVKSRTILHGDLLELDHQPGGTFDLTFKGIHWFSLLIFIFYLYRDVVLSVWTVFSPNKENTQLFQRVRSDLGLLAKQFGLRQLAAVASGLYTTKLTLDTDMEEALADPSFLDTGDMLLELKDKTIKVHSSLLCARCPFFDALYHGGSGRWLASRKGDEEYTSNQLVRVDMKHVPFETMQIVLKFLYSDKSVHLFDKVQVEKHGLDGFIDLVIDILGVANELMLDRLIEICHKTIGQFVNTRNATSILAAISGSSVVGFKDVCLEYIFRNLETMMETRALDELDGDLMVELDEAVKARQLAYMPISRSGILDSQLLEEHPHLAAAADSERAALLQLLDSGPSNASTEMESGSSPPLWKQSPAFRSSSYEKTKRRRSSKSGQEKPPAQSPPLVPAQGSELIFDMDEEDATTRLGRTPTSHSPGLFRKDSHSFSTSTPKDNVWYDCKGKQIADGNSTVNGRLIESSGPGVIDGVKPKLIESDGKQPWNTGSGIQSSKLDLKEIMAQVSKNRTSNLSLGLSSTVTSQELLGIESLPAASFVAPITAKVSQKERKRQQHIQAHQPAPTERAVPAVVEKEAVAIKASPWKAVTPSPSTPISLQALYQTPTSPISKPGRYAPSRPAATPNTPSTIQHASLGVNTPPKHPNQPPRTPQLTATKQQPLPTPPQIHTRRYNSSGDVISPPNRPAPARSASGTAQPRSERYNDFPPIGSRVEEAHLPLAEIIQQEQIQQDIVKGKGPKQSLQDIQQEQEFMDWWEKESERYRQEELERQTVAQTQAQKTSGVKGRGRGGGGGGTRARGGLRGRGGGGGQTGSGHSQVKGFDASTIPKHG
ncbi:hypothetical protein DRE_03903 [Drechslerella stenobrocha 248]|uniref:BTB domain-containing protein n=1 Tax=Drechslerella stenobrocha 248 TaxID=1043628 RepID=W7HS28_9PEZI|nr:hypothetical protein DRE_03903 [Drechslerella stenobrocha 248]